MTQSPLRTILFAFEEISDELELVPLAGRRALDHAGVHLSLAGWKSLSFEDRLAVAAAGAELAVDIPRVLDRASRARPAGSSITRGLDADATTPPDALVTALGPERSLDAATWSRLRPLDRFALLHALRRSVERHDPRRLAMTYDGILRPDMPPLSTHLSPKGDVRMVDVGAKAISVRTAVATGVVRMQRSTIERLASGDTPKGEVLATARVAGIMAAKRTSDLIPLCHAIALTRVKLDLDVDVAGASVTVTATAEALDRTGVEMEALTAVSVACLTLYDMLKGIDRAMSITDVTLLEKRGGRSGHYVREAPTS
jgi:cyclic pyranopterin phosphate synthase